MIENSQPDLLTEDFLTEHVIKRSTLIPTWIKVFSWIFIVLGAIAPFGLIAGIMGYNFELSIYGLEANEPLSVIGICLIVLFFVKAIVAFGLLKEQDWAVKLGIADAITGIVICIGVMIYQEIYFSSLSIRLELIPLIPYFMRLRFIKDQWETARINDVKP